MTPRYLLDTNTVSYFVKGTYPALRANVTAKPLHLLALSAITEAELRYWIANRPQEARLRVLIDDFILRVPALPWDAAAAHIYGELKADLKRLGRPIAELDLLIAAHALAIKATLISHDHVFRQIPHLRTEDWV